MGLSPLAHSSKRHLCTKYLVLKIYLGKNDGERQLLASNSHPSKSKREAATRDSQLFPKQKLRYNLALRGRVEMDRTGKMQSTTREQEAGTGEVETPLWRFNGELVVTTLGPPGKRDGSLRRHSWRAGPCVVPVSRLRPPALR